MAEVLGRFPTREEVILQDPDWVTDLSKLKLHVKFHEDVEKAEVI